MLRPAILLKRSLIFVHRWLGVALSVIFMLWFTSGIVMMYWDFPGVSAKDRTERAPVLDPSKIKLSPEEAYAVLGQDQPPTQATLTSFDGRPVYRFGSGVGGGRGGRAGRGGGGASMVYADDGTVQTDVTDAMVDRVAVAWTGRPLTDAKKDPVEEVDQWTVGSNLRNLRPLYKYSFSDGQQVYVSGRNAEVAQYTTPETRFWAYLGAIPHWLYFTPLRKHQPEWFKFVVWSSGIGTVAALLGVVVALWMLSPSKKYRYAGTPTSIPYKGWKRWHTIFGLVVGVVTVTWAFSGLLSMGPFDFVDRLTGNAPPQQANEKGKGGAKGGGRGGAVSIPNSLRGGGRFQLASYAPKDPRDAIAAVGAQFQVKELEFTTFAGDPIYLATNAEGKTRIVPVAGDPLDEFDRDRIINIVRLTAGTTLAEVRVMDQYDAYYLDRNRERPLPVIYARLNDEGQTRYYIDPKTGRVAATYTSRGWVNRWLYHGLHSLNFPWLYNYRPLWDIVVISLMLGGTALCVTSLVLTYRVLQRKLVAAIRAKMTPPNDDLVAGIAAGD